MEGDSEDDNEGEEDAAVDEDDDEVAGDVEGVFSLSVSPLDLEC